MWRHTWPPDIIVILISDRNPRGELTKSDLEIDTLVLHEANLLDVCPEANMAAPRSGSDNILTVSWSTGGASTIYPVVAELLRIRTLHLQKQISTPQSSTTRTRRIA